MRVEYTLQGMQPTVDPNVVRAATAGGPYGPTFGERLRRLSANVLTTWRQVLGVDQVPPGPTVLGPPPKPANFETRDPAETRMQWRRLLARSSSLMGQAAPGETSTSLVSPKVQRMHALLIEMQSMEN